MMARPPPSSNACRAASGDCDTSHADNAVQSRADEAGVAEVASVDSEDLLHGQREVHIVHHGVIYRLQATRAGKLILTK